MHLVENFKMAIESIKSNKLRSFLTMLGIIIGISSVITIISLGKGGKEIITSQLEKVGSSTIQINVDRERASRDDYITLTDIENINEDSESVKYVTPGILRIGVCIYNDVEKKAYVTGVNTDYKYIENAELLYGRYFTEKENEEGKLVGVIDEFTAESIFGYTDVVGEDILVGHKNSLKKLRIIGVIKSPEYMMAAPREYVPAMITMPIKGSFEVFGKSKIDFIYVLANTKDEIEEASNEAINIITSRHNNREKGIYRGEQIIKQVEEINKIIDIFNSFIGAVAAISLLVGGIGVMNIMLVSVTERTREIGIRKAIGANTKSILYQFLTEAIIISVIGGIMGLLLGGGVSYIVGGIMGISPSITFMHVILVIMFSCVVGIFFGIYPAKKAAELNPIDSLRHE